MVKANPDPKSTLRTLVFCVLATALAGCSQPRDHYPLMGGGIVDFDGLKGKAVLVVYWADWCTPCRQAIDDINRFAGERTGDVVTLGVNIDGVQGAALDKQAAASGIDFPVLLRDPRGRFGVEPSEVLPEILVVDRRGNFQQLLIGPQSPEALAMALSKLEDDMHYDHQEL